MNDNFGIMLTIEMRFRDRSWVVVMDRLIAIASASVQMELDCYLSGFLWQREHKPVPWSSVGVASQFWIGITHFVWTKEGYSI